MPLTPKPNSQLLITAATPRSIVLSAPLARVAADQRRRKRQAGIDGEQAVSASAAPRGAGDGAVSSRTAVVASSIQKPRR